MRKFVFHWGAFLATIATFAVPASIYAAPKENIAIETLLKGGWQIAGYTSTLDEPVGIHSLPASGRDLPRAVPRKLRRDPHAARHFELLQAAIAARLTA